MNDKIKKAVLIAHNNTHSTSRILRNLKLIREKKFDTKTFEERLSLIEEACLECRNQVDELYKLIKNEG